MFSFLVHFFLIFRKTLNILEQYNFFSTKFYTLQIFVFLAQIILF